MSTIHQDTICAVSTAPGTGGVAIIRVSGPDAIQSVHAIYAPMKSGKSLLTQSLYHHFRKHRMRRSAGGRGVGIPFSCTPFLYRRRHGRNYLSRIGIHTTTDTRTPYQTRLPVGFTRRIHPTCLPERQDGLKSGRSSGRPYCIHLCGNP